MITDGLDGLLESLTRQEADMTARLGTRTDQVCSGLSHLHRSLDATLRGLEAHATARQVRAVEDLDAERVRRLVFGGDLDQLSSKEARYVVLSFLQFPAERLAELLKLRPVLGRAFVRQALLRWESSLTRPDWEDYVKVLGRLPPSESPIEAPLSLPGIAGRDGARKAAEAVEAETLGEVHRTIVEDWRLQPSWSLTPHVLVEWMRRSVGTRHALSGPVRELFDSEGEVLRALLLPPAAPTVASGRSTSPSSPARRAVTHGSLLVQIRAVATLLEARFSQTMSLDEATFAVLEPTLLRSTFGDPRTVTISDAWKEVRTLSTQPYDAFLQGLVREDLALFFRHLMREEDRERFWLRYLGSIRRTLCVLDRGAYSALDGKLTGAPEATRAALGRVLRTRSKDLNGTCAFCLFFDEFVMVEFSVVGNAGYLYERQVFERRFFTRIKGGEFESPASLKDQGAAKFRLVHQRHWQHEMEMELLKYGIKADRLGARNTS